MLEVLLATGLTAEQAAFTADDTILADPDKYGFRLGVEISREA
jgi:hypothetical protein